ncbi:hypothetical protein EVA_09702, partial [gut metagenome]
DSLDENWKLQELPDGQIEMVPPATEGGFEKVILDMTGTKPSKN